MRATPFLSYTVDPDGPWASLGGHVQSLDAMPCGATPQGLQVFHLVAHGVVQDAVEALEQTLGERLHSIATVHYDRVTKRWQGEALLDDAGMEQSGLGPPLRMGGFEVPWIHIDQREASIRLVPSFDADLFVLHARLEKELGREVSVSYLDFAEYERWLRRLHAAA